MKCIISCCPLQGLLLNFASMESQAAGFESRWFTSCLGISVLRALAAQMSWRFWWSFAGSWVGHSHGWVGWYTRRECLLHLKAGTLAHSNSAVDEWVSQRMSQCHHYILHTAYPRPWSFWQWILPWRSCWRAWTGECWLMLPRSCWNNGRKWQKHREYTVDETLDDLRSHSLSQLIPMRRISVSKLLLIDSRSTWHTRRSCPNRFVQVHQSGVFPVSSPQIFVNVVNRFLLVWKDLGMQRLCPRFFYSYLVPWEH